ncbi:MAG: hypothetical protein SGBAC_012126 [Bacillariaceae sp.]
MSKVHVMQWLILLLLIIIIPEKCHSFSLPVSRASNIGWNSLKAVENDSTELLSVPPQQTSENEYSFFDEASIYVRAGSGGQGASTFKKAKKGQDGIPDGGNGGVGGNIVFHVDPSLNTLASFSRKQGERLQSFRAEGGRDGGRMYDNGRGGEDCVVRVPPGTVVSIEQDRSVDEMDIDQTDGETDPYRLSEVGTLTLDESSLVVARGGKGGEGTGALKGKKKGGTRRGPQGGERHRIRLTLKLIADVAVCGVPNAGKSTFLAAVTRSDPKIADYAFTTVVPNLGVWIPGENRNGKQQASANEENKAAGSAGVVICDVPGLIEGAADGVGLGHAFLRHVERCRVILHLIDGTSEDPVGDYKMVNEEIRRYGTGSLAEMPQVAVVNKIDAWRLLGNDEYEQRKADLGEKLKEAMGHTRLLWVSAKEKENVEELMQRMASYVTKIKADD